VSERIVVKIPRRVGRLPKMTHKVFRNRKKYTRKQKHKGIE